MPLERRETIRGVTPTYTTFLAQTLRDIYRISVLGTPLEYYHAVKRFILFLPNSVKKQISSESEKINAEVLGIMKTVNSPAGSYYTKVHQLDALRTLCRVMIDPLMGKIVSALDNRGYLEIPDHRIGRKEFDEWEASLEEEEARVEG